MQTWYYSSNGERQGPVSYDELEALARSGRLNPLTDLAWTEGMAEWQPSGQISGLFQHTSPALSAGNNPYAPPGTSSHDLLAPASGQEIAPGSCALVATEVIGRSFELTKRHFGMLVGIGLVYIVAGWAVGAVLNSINYMVSPPPTLPAGPGAGGVEAFYGISLAGLQHQSGISWLINLVSWGFSTFLALGLARVALNVVSGKEISVGMLFSQGDRIWRGLGASFLYFLMVAVGMVFLIIPGIYLALRFMMYQQVIVDRNLGVLDSLRYSSELTANNRFNLFVLMILAMLVMLAGALALLVGLIFAIPVVVLSFAVAYRFLQYGRTALQDQPGTTTPQLRALT